MLLMPYWGSCGSVYSNKYGLEMLDNILEPYCNFNLHNGCLNDIYIASDHIINKKMQRFLLEILVSECQTISIQIRTNVL